MQKFSTVIVGGGASGLLAAISAARKGGSVTICEKMPQAGKKILASGNGRCNLLNEDLNEKFYNPTARDAVRSVFSKFGKEDIKKLFNGLGLKIYSQEGRLFPVTNQSSSVLKVIDLEIKRLAVAIEFDFDVSDISHSGEGFIVSSKSGRKVTGSRLILAGGGRTYPALGSDGSGYKLASSFGHKIVEPVPVAVPLVAKDKLCHLLQGQKITASAKCIIGGKEVSSIDGELLFTKYGLSGTAILDISEDASIAINRYDKKDVSVSIDMVPFMDLKTLSEELESRLERKVPADDLLAGILPNRFGGALINILKSKDASRIAAGLKDVRFRIEGTRGWNEADFTAGGVDLKEINIDTLESKLRGGLYFAGEILDVNGKRGGYNLAWAWASGFVAGLAG